MRLIIAIFAMTCLLGSISSCNDTSKKEANPVEKTIDKSQMKEYASKYICPMHCEGSGSDVMGKCPVCEMDYELNENYKADDHDHGHDHDGHDHSHDGHNH